MSVAGRLPTRQSNPPGSTRMRKCVTSGDTFGKHDCLAGGETKFGRGPRRLRQTGMAVVVAQDFFRFGFPADFFAGSAGNSFSAASDAASS